MTRKFYNKNTGNIISLIVKLFLTKRVMSNFSQPDKV